MGKRKLNIIHLEDSPLDRELLAGMLASDYQLRVVAADSEASFAKALTEPDVHLIISDFTLPSYNGLAALTQARQVRPELPFIFFSGTIGEESAVETLTNGATDYVLKHRPQKLVAAIERAIRERDERESRLKAEEALRKREEWFRVLTENSNDIISVLDREGKCVYNSPSIERVLGYTPDELRGVNAFTLIHAEDTAAVRSAFEHTFENPAACSRTEFRIRHKAGAWRWLEAVGKKLPSGQEVQGLVINCRDITEKKETEARYLRAQRLECLGVLAGGIAHDLNNILSPVLMGAELLREYIDDPEALRILDTVAVSSQRGSEIIRQILSFARGASKGDTTELDLRHVLNEVVKLLRGTLPKSIQIQTRLAADLAHVRANPTEVHQVVMNLCVNARDAMPEGGLLQLRAQNVTVREGEMPELEAGKYVSLAVADTGMGISDEVRAKIFDPLFTTKPEGKGTGLGLPTVLGIVKRSGGALRIESAPGQGSTFTVYLPVPEITSTETAAEAPVRNDGRGQTVLLVDDEEAILEMARLILENANYRVLVASDGLQALRLFRKHKDECALILTDLAMPLMDGASLIQEIRKIKADVRILCATGRAPAGTDTARITALEARAVLRKPYSTEQLLRAVEASTSK